MRRRPRVLATSRIREKTRGLRVVSCGPSIVMMEAAEHGDGGDRTGEWGPDPLGGNRGLLPDSLVRPSRVEVAQCVFGEDVSKVQVRQDDQMVEALAADTPQKSFAH